MTQLFWPHLKIGDIVTVNELAEHSEIRNGFNGWDKKVTYKMVEPFSAIFVGYAFMNEGIITVDPDYGSDFRLTAKVKVAQVRRSMHTPIIKVKAVGLKKVEEVK